MLGELSRGQEPKRVASSMQLSIETVRSHIKAILGKALANNLRELLLRVATLPPIVAIDDLIQDGPSSLQRRPMTASPTAQVLEVR